MAKITIFGLAGTGTSSVGKKLAAELQYDFFSSGTVFRKKAADLGLTLNEFETLCSSDPEYDKMVDTEVEIYGKTHDNCVVESRLAWHFIPDSFKIKFDCDFDERIRRVAHRDNLPFEEAKEKTTHRERLHEERWPVYYGLDYAFLDSKSAEVFDLTINTTNIPIEEVVERIKTALHKATKIGLTAKATSV